MGLTQPSRRDELAAVLRHYALGQLRTAQRSRLGFVNDNWIVTTERGRFFVKRRHPDLRRPDVILAQHGLIDWLRQRRFPAPKIVSRLAGQTFLVQGDELYEVHEYIEGQPYDHDRLAHLGEAARCLARYHICVLGFSSRSLRELGDLYSPGRLKGVLADLNAAWHLDQDPGLAASLLRLEAHAAELAEHFVGYDALPHLVIHGDFYAGNLLFAGDQLVGVVDYDKARWQPRVVELAEALIYFASPRPGHLKHLVYPGILRWPPLVHFVQDYSRFIRLEESEMGALPHYVRCIWLQVSLTRLLECHPRLPPAARWALQEVLALADWAEANAEDLKQLLLSQRTTRV